MTSGATILIIFRYLVAYQLQATSDGYFKDDVPC